MNEENCTPLIKTLYDRWSVSVNIAARKCSVTMTFVIVPTLRFATGWEDYESHEVNQKNIDKFLKKQEGKTIQEQKEGENYF